MGNLDKILLAFLTLRLATLQVMLNHGLKLLRVVFGGLVFSRVDSYCYLGIEITSTGSFKVALKDLKIKAMRALISMKRTIDKTAISFKACCTIFDALIKPVILYASPIWATDLGHVTLS